MKKFRVEFNTSGFYSGQGIWDTLDVYCEIEADNESEAINLAKQWWLDNSDDRKEAEKEIESYVWRAAELKYNEGGYLEPYRWEYN